MYIGKKYLDDKIIKNLKKMKVLIKNSKNHLSKFYMFEF